MKAIQILKDYKNIDFGCNADSLHLEIDEAIAELKALENKSCNGCEYDDVDINDNCQRCKRYDYDDYYKAKE